MKKPLLIILSVLPACLFGQQNPNLPNMKYQVEQQVSNSTIGIDNPTSPYTAGGFYSSKLNKKHPGYAGILIGKTFYDLQTNASVGRRTILHDDGTVSAVWTTSSIGQAEWPTRGTGYNFKSTNWFSPVSARFEAERTGWPCLGVLENNGTKYEIVLGHVSTTGGWVVSTNPAVGSSAFTKLNTSLVQLNNKVAIWGRIGTNNKNIVHLVSNYFEDANGGVPQVKINGVKSPTTYSRSMDGGKTWDIQFSALPGYDSTRIVAGGGDNYTIDVKDSMVAIVTGGLGEDITLYKSMDNGTSFTKIQVEPFAFSPFYQKEILAENREKTTDGSMDVLIDHDNKVHVFFARNFVYDTDITDEGIFLTPTSTQIMHWAEGMDSIVVCGGIKDYNGNDSAEINPETYIALTSTGDLPSLTDYTLSSATRYGNNSMVTFPSSSIDANGNLYVVYSAPHELAISPFNANYRDVYVSYSTNNGRNWTIGQNLTANAYNVIPNSGKENVFASCAKRADNFLHFIYQEDALPGTNLQNNGKTNTHPNDENNIVYRAVPLTDILNGTIGDIAGVNKVFNDPKIFFVSQNQPNPFNSETQAFLYMRDGSDITLTITDMTGRVLSSKDLGYFAAGNNSISIDGSGLNAGLYLYTISNDLYSITKKMQVK
jgi:hypothetical protein